MENKKLIMFDLDGTTLNNDGSINKENLVALQKAKKQGHILAIATGRARGRSMKIYEEIGLDTIISNNNGAYISNPTDNSFAEITYVIPAKTVDEIFSLPGVRENLKDIMCEYHDTVYAANNEDIIMNAWHSSKVEKVVRVDTSKKFINDVSAMLLCIDDESARRHVQTFCDEHPDLIMRQWSIIPNEPSLFQINTLTGNKGNALKILAKHYGIDMKDTITFGDMTNDNEMLITSGTGIVVANGHKDAKAVADVVMELDNTQGAVAAWLNKNLLK